jgi:hypothetical protein
LSVGIGFELADAVESATCFSSSTAGGFGKDSEIVGSWGNPWRSAPNRSLNLFVAGGLVDEIAEVWVCLMDFQGLSENPEEGEGRVPLTVAAAQGFEVVVE